MIDREKKIEDFINNQLKFHPDADKTVLRFIAEFLYHGAPNVPLEQSCESIRSAFHAGYCYYFAIMLQTAFNRGEVCWAAPFGHLVWLDDSNIPYDIEGVNESDCDHHIPVKYLGDAINDFTHVEGREFNATEDDINRIIEAYKASQIYKNDNNKMENI